MSGEVGEGESTDRRPESVLRPLSREGLRALARSAVGLCILPGHVNEEVVATLAASIAMVESGGNPAALRYEPQYRWMESGQWAPPTCSDATEMTLQRCSLGVMQVMGATARGRVVQLRGEWLTTLLDPLSGMLAGCKYLVHLLDRYDYDIPDAVSAYNAGSAARVESTGKYANQRYVDRVLAEIDRHPPAGPMKAEE